MEIRFENKKITIVGATREEIIALAEFIQMPYNTVVDTEKVEVEVPVEKKVTKVSRKVNKPKERTDGSVTKAEFLKIWGKAEKTLYFHIKNGMPGVIKEGNRVYIKPDEALAYLNMHDKAHSSANNLPHKKAKAKVVSDYASWRREQQEFMVNHRLPINETKCYVYLRMRDAYGFVSDQVAKDFSYQFGIAKPRETMRLVYFWEYEANDRGCNEHIFESILEDIVSNVNEKAEYARYLTDVKTRAFKMTKANTIA